MTQQTQQQNAAITKGVSAIIIVKNRFLLVKPHGRRSWQLAGGTVLADEELLDALERHLKAQLLLNPQDYSVVAHGPFTITQHLNPLGHKTTQANDVCIVHAPHYDPSHYNRENLHSCVLVNKKQLVEYLPIATVETIHATLVYARLDLIMA